MSNIVGSEKIARTLKSEKEIGLAGLIMYALLAFMMIFIAVKTAKENPIFLLVAVVLAVVVSYIPFKLRTYFPLRSQIMLIFLAVIVLAPLGLAALFKDNYVSVVALNPVILMAVCAQVFFLRNREQKILYQLINNGCQIKVPVYLPIRNSNLAVELSREKLSDSIIIRLFYYSTNSKQKERINVKASFGRNTSANGQDTAVKYQFLNTNEVIKPTGALGTGVDTKAYFRQDGVD